MTFAQQHEFFRLVEQLGYDKEEAKNRAKARYSKEHFMELDTTEISPLINLLKKELEKTQDTTSEAPNLKEPKQDFPNEYRVWDREKQQMTYDADAIVAIEFQAQVDSVSGRFHIMQWTGFVDDNDIKIYDFDYVQSYLGKKYIIQWSWKNGAWLGFDIETNESMYLSTFGHKTRIGDVYTEAKE